MNHTLKQGLKKRRAPHSSPTEQISETQQQSIIDDLLTKAIDTELQFAVLGAIIWLTAALAYIYLLLFAEPNLTTPAPRNPPDPIYLLPLRLLSAATSFALAAVLLRPYAEGRRWLRQKYVVRGADLRRLQGWCVVVELLFAAYDLYTASDASITTSLLHCLPQLVSPLVLYNVNNFDDTRNDLDKMKGSKYKVIGGDAI